MEKKQLTAKSLLKSAQMREKYQCGICYEVCMKPVRCRGKCAKIFCIKCVSDTRQQLDQCPFKCSKPFLVERIPQINLDFYCPYNPSLCEIPIKSVRQFQQHYSECQYVSIEQRYLKKLQQQYQCLHGHQLQFFVGSYEEMLESNCEACKNTRLSRSYCRICQHYYCVECRIPPCSKEGCPIGHPFSYQRIANLNFICDICGVSTAVSNDGVFDDSYCNFGICEGCYAELPEKFDQSKPRQLIANVNTHCSCATRLVFGKSLNQIKTCSLCLRQKECPKGCPNCQRHYCLGCKLFDINFDNTCQAQHELNEIKPESNHLSPQFSLCMRCGKNQSPICYDEQCHVRLCQDCISYCKRVTSDKQRPVVMKCQNNHVLVYITGPEDWYDTCYSCGKERSIKLRCMYCEQDGISFCFQCRPKPLDTCYYKHKLRLVLLQSERECHFCRKQCHRLHFCKKCYFYVCQDCVCKSLEPQPMETENNAKEEGQMIAESSSQSYHKISQQETYLP